MISTTLAFKYFISICFLPWILRLIQQYFTALSQNNPKSETFWDLDEVGISGVNLAKRLKRIFLVKYKVKTKIKSKEEDRAWIFILRTLRKAGLNRTLISIFKGIYAPCYSFACSIGLAGENMLSCSTYSTKEGSMIKLTKRAKDKTNIGAITSVLHEFGHAFDNHKNFPLKKQKTFWAITSYVLSFILGGSLCIYLSMFSEKFSHNQEVTNFFNDQRLLYLQFSTVLLYYALIISYFLELKITLNMEINASKSAISKLKENFNELRVVTHDQVNSVEIMLGRLYQTYWNSLCVYKILHSLILIFLIFALPIPISIAIVTIQFCLQRYFRPYQRLSRLTLNFDDYSTGPSIPRSGSRFC